jgi:protein-L-isoaspartate O-methyltransferase
MERSFKKCSAANLWQGHWVMIPLGSCFDRQTPRRLTRITKGVTHAIMDAATYDRWYETPRGQWIGQREVSLVLDCLQPRPGESILDVGCGTGYFTRAIAESIDGKMVAADIKPEWVAYARGRDAGRSSYMETSQLVSRCHNGIPMMISGGGRCQANFA